MEGIDIGELGGNIFNDDIMSNIRERNREIIQTHLKYDCEALIQDLANLLGFEFTGMDGGLGNNTIPAPLYGGKYEDKDAGFFETDSNEIVMVIFNKDIEGNRKDISLTLPEVYANIMSCGKIESLESSGLKAMWTIRMLFDLERIELPSIYYQSLPDEIMDINTEDVYLAFILALRCHMFYMDDPSDNELIFTSKFGAEWIGTLSDKTVKRRMLWLREHGYIENIGDSINNRYRLIE